MTRLAGAVCACEAGTAKLATAVIAVHASMNDLADVIVAGLRNKGEGGATAAGREFAKRPGAGQETFR